MNATFSLRWYFIIVLDFSSVLYVVFLIFPPLLLVWGFYLKGIFQLSGVIGCLFIPYGGIEVDLKLCMGGAFWLVHFTKLLGE